MPDRARPPLLRLPMRVLLGLLAGPLVLGTAGAVLRQGQPPRKEQRQPPPATEEQLVRAVFFLEGDLAGKIPELKRMREHPSVRFTSQRQRQDIHAFQDQLLREMRRTQPDWLAEFNADLRSGDRSRIARQIKKTHALIEQVSTDDKRLANSRRRIQGDWIADQKASGNASKVIVEKVEIDKAVITLYPPLSYAHWNLTSASRGSRLLSERLVNSLAEHLKP